MSAPAVTVPLVDRTLVHRRVESALHEFLDRKAVFAAEHRLPSDVVDAVRSFVFGGGQRVRAAFCVLGWYSGGGAELTEEVVRAAAAIELFHTGISIHDDFIDDSETRDDRPTVHRALTDRTRRARQGRRAEEFGARAAIVIGDCAMAWAQELLHSAGFPLERTAAAAAVLDAMRTEVGYGRYLEVMTTGRPTSDLEQALEIIRYRCAAYLVERPLHLGAVLAGAGSEVLKSLTAYAHPLGEAIRLRDELRRVFGDVRHGAESGLRDLRDGRHTVLLALGLRHAAVPHRDRLHSLVGDVRLDERGAAECREILATAAQSEVAAMIRDRLDRVQSALDAAPFSSAVVASLLRTAAEVTSLRAQHG